MIWLNMSMEKKIKKHEDAAAEKAEIKRLATEIKNEFEKDEQAQKQLLFDIKDAFVGIQSIVQRI